MTHTPPLPHAVSGARHEIATRAGRVSYYEAAPDTDTGAPPLLLVHSVNAAGSACEVRPLFEHYRAQRRVVALDLPGFGFSERTDRAYTPRLMTDAVLAVTEHVQGANPGAGLDALALSLSSEFLARAAVEAPERFGTIALVSPTGFSGAKPRMGPPGATQRMEWLAAALRFPLWDRGLFDLLTTPRVMRYFLERTWGSKQIDEGLLAYDIPLTRQPGARFAPYAFLSGGLFSRDARRLYESLVQPVWMVHGVRGDFVDYRQKRDFEGRPRWRFDVLPTGALPHFELPGEFTRRYDGFLAGCEGDRS